MSSDNALQFDCSSSSSESRITISSRELMKDGSSRYKDVQYTLLKT